jgi:pimeloyl-ACP methyl ester carboxylesterase
MSGPVGRSLDEMSELSMHPTGFRPPVLTAVRENLSVLRVAGRLLPRRPTPTTVDPAMVPALLVPGFLSGDFALAPMSDELRRRGHWTTKSGVAPNIGCTRDLADALEARLELAVERTGHKVAIVGWSRGGTLAKIVTVRRPELVAGLVTLGTPNTDPLAVNVTLAAQLQILVRLSAWGFPGVLGEDCLSGDCARQVRSWLDADFPTGIPYTSLFSLDDGVIDWRACLDPAAEHVEISATHMSMGAEPEVIDVVATLLARITPTPLAP